jgi:murein DD-endopeptidase MepM/ murein hydrolase activator NlpD
MESGTVISISHSTRGGNQILIQNEDGSISGSAHTVATPGVAVGVRVREGQRVGESDGSGTTSAGTPVRPHLHQTYRLCRKCEKTDLYEQFRKEQQRERRQRDMERQRLGERKS